MKQLNATDTLLLTLLRFAMGQETQGEADTLTRTDWHDTDWMELIKKAMRGGAATLAYDGFLRSPLSSDDLCPINQSGLRKLKLTWIGLEIPQSEKYRRQAEVLKKLERFFATKGVEMIAIKGYPLSLCYPKPELRPSSDVDIYCPDNYDLSNQLIEQTGVKIDYSQHKHSVFTIDGVPVENHHTLLNTHGHRSSRLLEEKLRSKGITSPSAMLLYLLRHSAENFTASQALIKQVTDFGLYAKANAGNIDWSWLTTTADEAGMSLYLDLFINICTEYLGFDQSLFPLRHIDAQLLQRSLSDIISPEFQEEHPTNLPAELLYKLRRWLSNRWKHRMVYADESLATTFLTQLWSHLLKPSSMKYGMKTA